MGFAITYIIQLHKYKPRTLNPETLRTISKIPAAENDIQNPQTERAIPKIPAAENDIPNSLSRHLD